MDKFIKLSADRRRDACMEVYQAMQLDAASVGKDFWVCWTLRELFTLPGVGEHLTFKGPEKGSHAKDKD